MFLNYFLLIVSTLFIYSHGDNSTSLCSTTYDCGNGVVIKYPFWLNTNNTSNQLCGYQKFGLICSGNEPLLSLPGGTYYVKDISYDNYTIKLVNAALVNLTCPRVRHNVTIDTLPLNFSNLTLNLSFYFNCSLNPFKTNVSPIGCLGFGTRQSYVIEIEQDVETGWFEICEDHVVAKVLRSEVGNDLISGFGAAMNAGFVLDWDVPRECDACEIVDGGRCGYDQRQEMFLCFCEDGTISGGKNGSRCRGRQNNWRRKVIIIVGSLSMGIGFLCASMFCYFRKSEKKNNRDIEAFMRNYGSLIPTRYTYADVKKITHLFKEKLGQGGFGTVYKGKLLDGRLVAVKMLNETKGNGEEFINEVASISRTSHVNVVSLLGFCLERHKRALIYEFMPNGSLDKFIGSENHQNTERHLDWEKLYQIAFGVARGLEYLHRGCNTRIIHFDIKPHNILLDKDFFPKISDFGLSKLCTKEKSILSLLEARGTIGYIAPEVFSRTFGAVSHKSDVYSYGMVLLEMVGEKEKDDSVVSDASEKYFPYWVYKHVELNKFGDLGVSAVEDIEIVRKMAIVGLWCIQINPSDRPSMSKVIEMFERNTEVLEVPPKPFLFSPTKSASDSSALLSLFNIPSSSN